MGKKQRRTLEEGDGGELIQCVCVCISCQSQDSADTDLGVQISNSINEHSVGPVRRAAVVGLALTLLHAVGLTALPLQKTQKKTKIINT